MNLFDWFLYLLHLLQDFACKELSLLSAVFRHLNYIAVVLGMPTSLLSDRVTLKRVIRVSRNALSYILYKILEWESKNRRLMKIFTKFLWNWTKKN